METPSDTWRLDTRHIGRHVLVYDSVASTNDVAAALAADPANAGTVVLAGQQTAGRGQYGRVWQSRPGMSLLMSVILAPPEVLRRPVVLTAWAAVGVGEAIRTLTGVQARLKWPNDLLLHGKKVCGILIEQGAGTVAGVGLNLNQSAVDFNEAGLPDATSLMLTSGAVMEPRAAAVAVIRRLDEEFDRLLAGEWVPLESDWKWRLGLLGRRVVAEMADGSALGGRLRELSFDGIEIEVGESAIEVVRPEFVRQLRPG
ncbi:MAG TPA: biotin--[acetyl-CoA-carboxylase] ligase [Fimbriiglobus sp.]|jgi:BirA family biotin operon repressor/biotin-[acetyl-CoA-carboxylase] ligase|nr:biotin--[acetyl-CoA-carboxylase] ligase [Fimbriiglobus sp.]